MGSSLWLGLYFVLNLLLTLYNKLVLIHFPFPYTLTALHALCGAVGTFILLHWPVLTARIASFFDTLLRRPQPERKLHLAGFTSPFLPPVPSVQGREIVVVLLFSVLYTVNIVVSNASLRLVTVPFHQCIRASAPLFTIALSALLFGQYSSRAKLISLIPVVAGVGFATYGDYYFTPQGFLLTLLGTLLAAFKTILTNVLQKPSSSRLKDTLIEKSLYPPLSLTSTYKFPSSEKRTVQSPSSNSGTNDDPDHQTEPLLRAFKPDTNDKMAFMLSVPVRPSKARRPSALILAVYHRLRYYLRIPPAYISGRLNLPKLTLSPLQLLYLLSPLAFIQATLLAHFTGELERVSVHLHEVSKDFIQENGNYTFGNLVGGMGLLGLGGVDSAPRTWLLLNGLLAFALNIVSFSANRQVGALGMSVAANVKQVLAVLCSVALFNLTITPPNGLGILLTLLGGAWYAAVELREKKKRVLEAASTNV